jgi:hypothetical protein
LLQVPAKSNTNAAAISAPYSGKKAIIMLWLATARIKQPFSCIEFDPIDAPAQAVLVLFHLREYFS